MDLVSDVCGYIIWCACIIARMYTPQVSVAPKVHSLEHAHQNRRRQVAPSRDVGQRPKHEETFFLVKGLQTG